MKRLPLNIHLIPSLSVSFTEMMHNNTHDQKTAFLCDVAVNGKIL